MNKDIERAALFGVAAMEYDAYRPGYPSSLIEEMLGLSMDCVDSGHPVIGLQSGFSWESSKKSILKNTIMI
ncbi:MAG: hypothetical protein NTY16_08045 [Deltaproteobacteria bacterium]|nr:hypothetical protein [Deltaproteobacteria bacterium]